MFWNLHSNFIVVDLLFVDAPKVCGVYVFSCFCDEAPNAHSSFTIILLNNRELVAFTLIEFLHFLVILIFRPGSPCNKWDHDKLTCL